MLTDPTMRRVMGDARIEELRRFARRPAEPRISNAEARRERQSLTAELRWLRWLRAR